MRSPQPSQVARAALAGVIYTALVASTGVHTASAAVIEPPAPALSTSWSFASSGLDGAGFQNVIAASPYRAPTGNRPILVGADVAGIHRSTDGGRTWVSSDEGLPDSHVAGFLWSWDVPGKVYVATKTAISVSTDWGWTWQRQAGRVAFDPNGGWQATPGEEHPRSTGRLLEQATVGTTHYLWAGTATQGLKRSSDDGRTWQQTALVGAHIRGIRLDPDDPDVLYVAVARAGVYVSTNARDGMTFALIPGSPPKPEELTYVNHLLYVVANTDGVFSYDGSWHSLNAGIPAGSAWESITGYTAPAGNSVLFVGCTGPQNGKAVMKSTDGGQTWTAVTTGPGVTVSRLEYGSSRPWWANGIGYLSFAGRSYVASQLIVDPDDHNSVLVAGRGGVWRGSPAGSGTIWSPAMNGLMVTVNMAVAADAKVGGRVFIGNMDYTSFGSTDGGADVVRTLPTGAPSTGDVVTLDSGTDPGQPSAVYLAASQRGGSTGEGGIWSSSDPMRGTWQSERLPVSSDVTALGVGHPAGGRIILAGVSQHGFWRKSGSVWTRITGAAPFQNQSTGSFAWARGGTTVYALDSFGVWRSAAAGAAGTWTKLMNASSDYHILDALVVDPADSDTVYVSAMGLGGVWRISGAGTVVPSRTRILGLRDPGPIAVDGAGDIFVHDVGAVALWRSTDPGDAKPTFTVVSDDYYHTNNRMIRSLSIGPDGYIYTASNHAGVTVGVPAASAG